MRFDRIVDAVLPRSCLACGARSAPLCASCRAVCPAAVAVRPPEFIAAWAAPFAYVGAVRELVARAKYRNEHHALGWLAACAAEHRRIVSDDDLPDLVVWIPTTAARRRSRGFDHARILARGIAREFALPVADSLARLDDSPQTGRVRAQRWHGPRFAVAAGQAARSVLLVDDVATTGATLASAASVLRAAGVQRIEALTVARTPPPSMRAACGQSVPLPAMRSRAG